MVGVTTNNQNYYSAFKNGWNLSLGSSYGILDYYSNIDCDDWDPIIRLSNANNIQFIKYSKCPSADELNYFSIDLLNIESDETYQIEIENVSFPRIRSSYEHPNMVPMKIVDFTYIGPGEYDFYGRYQIPGDIYYLILEVQDPEALNYYELSADLKFEYDPGETQDSIPWEQQGLISFEPLNSDFAIQKSGLREPFSLLFTDETFNNLTKIVKIKCFVDERFTVGLSDNYKQYVLATLRNYSPGLFQYYKTTYIQKLSEMDPNSSPLPIPSNIDGGFGIFGGYAENVQSLEIDLINH
ncbi:MAG: DUF4249 family protein [Bacteroidota bacterium]